MRVEALRNERLDEFITYCKMHRREVDDSYLYDEDLKEFQPNEENPTYIILDDHDKVIAAASLIMDDYNRRGKKARFRILHSEIADADYYDMLLKPLFKHTDGLNKLNIFVPLIDEATMKHMESIGFEGERYSFLLVRENQDVPEWSLPDGYEIKPFRPGLDEGIWCVVRNASFAKLQGSETPATPEMIVKMVSAEGYLEGGMMILYHRGKPVGVVRGEGDEYEDRPIMNIGPLAIIPEYQGQGLGRILLRASLTFAKEHGFDRAILCVNGENDRAKALYLQEGFVQTEGVICYKYQLGSK